MFDRAALWRVYLYLINSTSMQKENSFWNSVRQIKIRCAKYKFAERGHNFLGTASKPNRRLTGGSVRFRTVSIVPNNDNRLEPDGTAGQPAVGFWSCPLMQSPMQLIFGDPWDLDKLQACAKGKSILEFRSVWKEIQKIQTIKAEQKSTKKVVWPSRPLESICSFD